MLGCRSLACWRSQPWPVLCHWQSSEPGGGDSPAVCCQDDLGSKGESVLCAGIKGKSLTTTAHLSPAFHFLSFLGRLSWSVLYHPAIHNQEDWKRKDLTQVSLSLALNGPWIEMKRWESAPLGIGRELAPVSWSAPQVSEWMDFLKGSIELHYFLAVLCLCLSVF